MGRAEPAARDRPLHPWLGVPGLRHALAALVLRPSATHRTVQAAPTVTTQVPQPGRRPRDGGTLHAAEQARGGRLMSIEGLKVGAVQVLVGAMAVVIELQFHVIERL